MTQNDLREKVINAEAKVAKRKAVLKKHREQLAKLIQKGADKFDISIKKDDIESAKRKLEEAEKILNNWKEKLDERITADDYLEANAPEILKDFLENWKQHAIAYYRQRRIDVIEFRKDLKAQERAARLEALQTLPSLERARKLYEGREVTDYDLANLWPRKDVDEFLHERGLDYYQIQRKLKGEGDGVTFRLLEIHDEQEREAWLERTMEEEKRAKLLDLTADDGLKDYGTCTVTIFSLTVDQYRRNRDVIPLVDDWYWLSTAYSTAANGYEHSARRVGNDGTLSWYDAYHGNYGLRPACYLDSDLLISVDSEDTGIGPQEAGTIVAELVEQFGGSYATGEQFTAEVSFPLGKLRAAREMEAAHE